MSRDGWLAAWPADWRLTMDAVYDAVKAGLPRLLVETAAKLGRQDVQQSSFHSLVVAGRDVSVLVLMV